MQSLLAVCMSVTLAGINPSLPAMVEEISAKKKAWQGPLSPGPYHTPKPSWPLCDDPKRLDVQGILHH